MAPSSIVVQPYEPHHLEAVVELSLRAWAPVFQELEKALEPAVYEAFYPEGWRGSQSKDVRAVCTEGDARVWVATYDARIAGFVAVKVQARAVLGEIYMIAVDPALQRRGIASALTRFALAFMKRAGVSVAMVDTGGDPGHAPARRAYERAGFRELPLSRYFMKL